MAKRPFKDYGNADEDLSPDAVKRTRKRQEKARERMKNPMLRIADKPINRIREEQRAKREAYQAGWSPPALVKAAARELSIKTGMPVPLKRCDECKAGRHHKTRADDCSCECPGAKP